jgi:hypothetical protein
MVRLNLPEDDPHSFRLPIRKGFIEGDFDEALVEPGYDAAMTT